MCVPDCKVYGCQNDPTGSLQCADDGLCYLTSVCEGDSDCDDLPGQDAWTCLNLSTSAISDFPIPNAGNFTSMCGVQCDTDEDCDAFPWGKCLAETTCISQPPSTDVFTNMTDWVTTCESDDDCTDEDLANCMEVDFMDDGVCVSEDATILENFGVNIFVRVMTIVMVLPVLRRLRICPEESVSVPKPFVRTMRTARSCSMTHGLALRFRIYHIICAVTLTEMQFRAR